MIVSIDQWQRVCITENAGGMKKKKYNHLLYCYTCPLCTEVLIYTRKIDRPIRCTKKRCRLPLIDSCIDLKLKQI